MAGRCTVVLCGGPDIAVDGRRQRRPPPARRQATFALAYLLHCGRPVPADELAEATWPQGPPQSWPAGLRRIVSEVRAWLLAGGIDAELGAVQGTYEVILPEGVVTDVDAATAALAQAGIAASTGDADAESDLARRAVDLLSGTLLPGYEAPWLQERRRNLEQDLLDGLDQLADAERRRGNPRMALEAAAQAISIDPLRESSHRQAMAAHRAAGRIGAALRQYEACRRVLADELGTLPAPATTAAYRALLDLRVDPRPASRPEPSTDPASALASAADAMRRLESGQSVAVLEARLASIDSSPNPDPLARVETLVELGRARWHLEGSTEALRRISLAAGEAALSLEAPGLFGDALALASTTTGIGQTDPDADSLCRRGGEAFAADARVQVQVLGLQAELSCGVTSIDLAEQAVAGARLVGDDRLLLDMLFVLDQSLAWLPDVDRRLAVEAECNRLLKVVPSGWRRRPSFEVMTRLQAGDVEWLDKEGARQPEVPRPSESWELRVYLSALWAVSAKLTGDLATAHRLALELLQESGHELNSTHAAGALLLALGREMGDVEDLLPAVEAIAASNPRIAAFRAAAALARATIGDHPAAVEHLEALAAAGLDEVPHDHVYLLYLGLLAETVALVGRADLAEHLLPLLEPYAGQLCVGAHGLVVLNATDTYRGMLATVTGDPRGPTWFQSGAEVEGRVRALLLRAPTLAWWAAWSRLHGAPGAESQADDLHAKARAVATAAADRAGLLAMVDRLAAPR